MTLVDLCVSMFLAGVVAVGGYETVRLLSREAAADTVTGVHAEQACSLLRRDLMHPARISDGTLVVSTPHGEVRWEVVAGELLRDGRHLIAVDAHAWRITERGITVTLRPHGLPVRTIATMLGATP